MCGVHVCALGAVCVAGVGIVRAVCCCMYGWGCAECIRHLPSHPLLPGQRLGGTGAQPVSLTRKRKPWPWLYLGLVIEGLFWSLGLHVNREDGQTGKKKKLNSAQSLAFGSVQATALGWAASA